MNKLICLLFFSILLFIYAFSNITAQENETVQEPEPVQESESVLESEPVLEPEPVQEPEPVKSLEPVQHKAEKISSKKSQSVFFIMGTGIYHEYISFKSHGVNTYNAYIHRYFKNDGANLTGSKFFVGLKFSESLLRRIFSEALPSVLTGFQLTLETYSASSDLPYKSISGENKKNNISLRYYQITFTSIHSFGSLWDSYKHALKVSIGVGNSDLTRIFNGTYTEQITADNVAKNQGTAESSTTAPYILTEIGYHLSYSYLNIGLIYGYKFGNHFIPLDDPRPARDEDNILSSSYFQISSFYYNLQLYVEI